MSDAERLIEASSLGTPEARALRESTPPEVARAIVARAEAMQGAVLDPTWEQVTEPLEPLARELARLHAPTTQEPGYPDGVARDIRTCEGCDWAGWEGEAPDWPCRSADLVLTHLGLEPDGRGVRS